MSREVELGTLMYLLERERKELEDKAKSAKERYDAAAKDLMDILVEEGKSSTGMISGVGEFSLVRKVFPSVKKDNLPQFIAYLRQEGDGGLVKETVDAGTVSAYLKEKIATLEAIMTDDNYIKARYRIACNLPDDASTHDIAVSMLSPAGVSVFSECKLSHTQKGKK